MKLFYRIYGSGPPLIILHGLYGSSDNWVSIARKLAGNFTVILPDQRNHGQSPHSMIHDYTAMKNDLHSLVSELGIGKFFLAGHSMGGKTAAAYAIDNQEMLLGLLIADISPFSKRGNDSKEFEQHNQILNFMISTRISGITSRQEIDSLLKNKIDLEKTRSLILKNLNRNQDNSFSWKINARALSDNLENIMAPVEPGNEEITGFPVYFLKGEYSDYLQDTDHKKILEVFPAAEFITIPKAGHWIHADNPDSVIDCFNRFIVNP